MAKNDDAAQLYFWTGAYTIDLDEPRHFTGLVGETSPVTGPGMVHLSFTRKTCPPEKTQSHLAFYLSETTARRLIEQLTRTVDCAETMRACYRAGVLCEERLMHRDQVPPELLGGPNNDKSEGEEP
jgi:hypothetical protein